MKVLAKGMRAIIFVGERQAIVTIQILGMIYDMEMQTAGLHLTDFLTAGDAQ